VPAQRPSWNYRKEDGGGIIMDMLCHWRYVLDNLFGAVKAVSCLGATHIPRALGRSRPAVRATADDAAYATFELAGGIVAHFNSSWCVRVRRDDLLTLQVDGTLGQRGRRPAPLLDSTLRRHAAAGLEPRYRKPARFFEGWQKCPSRTLSTTPSSASGNCSCATW
jgi:predicted dehydrogenase